MKPILKRLRYLLSLYDGVWAIPAAAGAFILGGIVLQKLFSNPDDPQGGPGFYDPSFLQLALYVTCMQVFLNFTVWLGIKFNFRGLWIYYKGKRVAGSIENQSKADFLNLLSWQRIVILLFVYCFLSLQWLLLFSLLR